MELMERLKAQAEQARQGVDAYHADILDNPVSTRTQMLRRLRLLRLQAPVARVVDDPNLYMDSSFNNSPYVPSYTESGVPRRDDSGRPLVIDTRQSSGVLPGANFLELWAGEMRALSEKEMSGAPLSGDEEQLLRQYQEYFGGRTGFKKGGVVMMRSDMSSQMEGGIGGLSDRARDMFSRPRGVGTFEQYMNEGGSVGVSSDVLDRLRQRIIEETGTDPFDIAREEGIDPDLMLRVIQQESSGNPNAQSKKGAFGYMQLMPATAKELGVDRMDPVQNMRGGARYLRQQLDEFRTVPLALAAYNAGPTVTRRYGAIPPYKETIKYVSRITGIPFTDPSLGQTRSQAAAELGVVRPIARPADLRDPRAAQEDLILQLLQQSMQGSQQVQPAPQPQQPQQNPNPILSSLRPIARPAQFGMPEGASPFAVQPPPVLPGARSVLPQSVLRPIARPTGQ
jgi:hypothetical protein